MNAAVDAPKKLWTEAGLQALPEDGFIHEVVNGELVVSPKNNWVPRSDLLAAFGCFVRVQPQPQT